MKPEEDLESPSEITKSLMAISQVKQVTPDDLTNEVKQMSKRYEAPEEIFLQVDPEGDGPGEWDTLDGATWCQERINHNDVRYVRADRVMQLEAENKRLRAALEKTVIEWPDYTPGTHFARLKAALDKEYKP